MQESLTTGLGLFTMLIALSMGLRILTDPAAQPGDDLAVLAAVLLGVVVGELIHLHDGLEGLGGWFQRRLAGDNRPGRIAEGFVTASLVFCVGPLTILGSLENGLTGDVQLLAIKSLLDGVATIAFAAALGPGVALAALTVLIVQGAIAGAAFLLRDVMDAATILAVTAAGGVILLGVALRLFELKPVRVASFFRRSCLPPCSCGWRMRPHRAELGQFRPPERAAHVAGPITAGVDHQGEANSASESGSGSPTRPSCRRAPRGDVPAGRPIAVLDLRRDPHRRVTERCGRRKRARRQPDGQHAFGPALAHDPRRIGP